MKRIVSIAKHARSQLTHAVHPAPIEWPDYTSCGRWLGRPAWTISPGDIQVVDCRSCLTALGSQATRA